MRFRASQLAAAIGGELCGPDVDIDGVAHDSRAVTGGELFVPLLDVRDGHDFIPAALAAGAAAYLTARSPGLRGPNAEAGEGSAIVVADTAAALAEIGRVARARLPERVVGVTGSVGKTSVKDLAGAVLGRRYRTHASLRSFNNEYGVPLTLANADDGTEAAIVEMGARGIGHIGHLCTIARPTVGVVTTVEAVHTEMFGDLDGVAVAKGELVESLPPTGTAVLNAANRRVAAMAARTDADVVTFSAEPGTEADVVATDVRLDGDLRARFTLRSPWGAADVHLGVRGEHQVANALAAAAVGLALGVDVADVADGLRAAELSPWRMELATAADGTVVLNDAYNAGPASMAAALRSLAQLPATRHVAVLGTMAELGEHGPAAHRDVAGQAARLGIAVVAVAAPLYGDGDGVVHVADLDAARAHLAPLVGPGTAVLVKGSRVVGLERLATSLLADPTP
jgi:UDP-N-acetylmuramoyl-tripeptide--D-alanyl-D-alanine ligase